MSSHFFMPGASTFANYANTKQAAILRPRIYLIAREFSLGFYARKSGPYMCFVKLRCVMATVPHDVL
jgi:hypothetical protein